jgi:hypothetical protein
MLVSTILLWIAIASAIVVSLPALWLCGLALWPASVQKRTEAASLGLGRPLLLGLVPLAVTVLLASRLGKGGAAAAIVLGVLLLWGFASADGLSTLIGRKVWPNLRESQPWKQTMRGGFLLMGAALLPILGWVFILPLLAVLGWGISIRSLFLKPDTAEGPAVSE